MKRRKRRRSMHHRPAIDGTGPIRTCVGCGSRDRQPRLIRLGLAASGGLMIAGKPQSGRSAYVHFDDACVRAVESTKLLRRSLRADVDENGRAAVIAELVKTGIDANDGN